MKNGLFGTVSPFAMMSPEDPAGGGAGGTGGGTGDGKGGAGDGKGGAGDGKGGKEVEFNLQEVLSDPKAKPVMLDWAEREVAGPLKAKNTELLNKLAPFKIEDKDGKLVPMDAEEAKTAIKAHREGRTPEVRAEVERAVAEANNRHKGELTLVQTENEQLKRQAGIEREKRHTMMIDNQLTRALLDSQIKVKKMPLHQRAIRDQLEIIVDGSEEKVVVRGTDNKPRYGTNGLMTVAEFVNEYRNGEGNADDWEPTARGGSGTTPGASGGRSSGYIDPSLPPAERLKMARALAAGGGGRSSVPGRR